MGNPRYFHHHSRQEAPAKQDPASGECFEKLMETGASVTLCHTSPSVWGEFSWNGCQSISETHKIDAFSTADLKQHPLVSDAGREGLEKPVFPKIIGVG